MVNSSLNIRTTNSRVQEYINTKQNSAIFKKNDAPSFCLYEFNEETKKCLKQYPIYNWMNENNGSFFKRIWELLVWGFSSSLSGKLTECYKSAIKNLGICINTDVSVAYKIFDYVDNWSIRHKMGNCNGLTVPKSQAEKILGCDGKTLQNIMNPRENMSKGKVIHCNTDLPNSRWCACPGYPQYNSESTWNEEMRSCKCNNPLFVPHYHYLRNNTNTFPITCCGPPCDYGYEYDCIDRVCKKSLYTFEK